MYYRLIKPEWGKRFIKNTGTLNPAFVREIEGPDVIEEPNLSDSFIKEKNKAGYNCYYFPNHPSKKVEGNVNGSHIDVWNYVFVDMDLKDQIYKTKEEFLDKVRQFPIVPSLTIDSGNGIHVYWKIKDLNRTNYMSTQFRLIELFNTDKTVWKLCQLLRVPNTFNTKDANKFKAVVSVSDLSSHKTYEVEELWKHLPEERGANKYKTEIHLSKADGTYKPNVGILDSEEIPQRFTKLLENNEKAYMLFNEPRAMKNDRSAADMALCNLLFSKEFSRKEAMQVMLNTEKARSYPGNKEDYAGSIVDKVYTDRPKYVVETVGKKTRAGTVRKAGEKIHGPGYVDGTERGWRRRDVVGIIGGEGIGKTTLTLSTFKAIAENNPHLDELFIYFSLEMGDEEIIEKWHELVGVDSALSDRLAVISNEDDDGNAREIGLQEIYWYVKQMEQYHGKKVAAIAIDHLTAMSNIIDTTRAPNFDVVANQEFGYGDKRAIPLKDLATRLKWLAKSLDVLLLIQSQTTKERAGEGDVPIRGNAAYGISQLNWYCDQVMTIWQPLRRVHKDIELRITAFQFVKIRGIKKNDRIRVYEPKLLAFDQDTGNYRALSDDEMEQFKHWITIVNKIRQMEAKKQLNDNQYSNTIEAEKIKAVIRRFDSRSSEQ